ncbi:hypothetical protein Tco_1288364, partial [Tanacetum coccineum]
AHLSDELKEAKDCLGFLSARLFRLASSIEPNTCLFARVLAEAGVPEDEMEALERQLAPKDDSAARKPGFVSSSIQLSETTSGSTIKKKLNFQKEAKAMKAKSKLHKKMYQMLCTEEVLLGNETKKKRKKRRLVHVKELSGCDKNQFDVGVYLI